MTKINKNRQDSFHIFLKLTNWSHYLHLFDKRPRSSYLIKCCIIYLDGGEKPKLYELARKGYLLNMEEGDGGADDFIHTQNFALIDKQGRIRGFYDGTKTDEVDNLIKDIDFVLQEK